MPTEKGEREREAVIAFSDRANLKIKQLRECKNVVKANAKRVEG